ncbi:hypothetical protein TVAG_098480 [Trichomonas vaginalis G3]|uniref:Uncharacterized protein n=1 Tax=Trichomonas vaginalis (strain ATCC PRA-98 / G3) TaxID=412133 RepID=A2ECC9_TRIV3|nr:hypothetical protein TVAGG3_0391110 [Trichomonas vaginalis G3]EAY09713.1 hypothetical protein TVAG_098480 [Trichomonas vaginalis G3]KAI5534001.1 hypothetical protein TVAGG3_0391110 [Trichomonas vaginalis G3]|eukprot:XP_001321936.1 hypothetical protein [Trichomonas vaginalis G3]
MKVREKRKKRIEVVYYLVASAIVMEIIRHIVPFPPTKISKYDPQILISINCNNPNCERAYYSYNKWGRNFMKLYPKSKVMLTSINNTIDPRMVILSQEHNETIKHRQMYHNNFALYKYFLKTRYNYVYRCTEDVYVDAENLAYEIFKLDLKHQNFMITSQYCTPELINTSVGFIHGGSGWILNRFTARFWVEKKRYFDDFFSFHDKVGDDVTTEEFISLMKLNFEDVHLKSFIGWPLFYEDIDQLKNKNWSAFGKCPPPLNKFKTPVRVKQIAAWHSGLDETYVFHHGDEIIRNAPDNLMIQAYDSHSILCYL